VCKKACMYSMYVRMHACILVSICLCVHLSIHVSVCVCAFMCVCVCVISVCVCMCHIQCVCVCVCEWLCVVCVGQMVHAGEARWWQDDQGAMFHLLVALGNRCVCVTCLSHIHTPIPYRLTPGQTGVCVSLGYHPYTHTAVHLGKR
jgi:hypothetical protein